MPSLEEQERNLDIELGRLPFMSKLYRRIGFVTMEPWKDQEDLIYELYENDIPLKEGDMIATDSNGKSWIVKKDEFDEFWRTGVDRN